MLLGAHVSTAGGFGKAVERAASIGCTAAQIFVKNNMQWMAGELGAGEVEAFKNHPGRESVPFWFGHTGYLINVAAQGANRAASLDSLALELARAEALDLPFLVLHPGAHLGSGEEAGLAAAAEGLDEVFGRAPKARVKIALENTAGQGTCLGHDLTHLTAIRDRMKHAKRICFCIDTAHLFEAGHDLGDEKSTKATLRLVEQTLGWENVAALHLNDSKTALGSRVDRHEHIGKGRIGETAFRIIMRSRTLASIPKVLETPKGKEMREDVENMALLRSFAANGGGE